ncbi:hypothetical protein BHM03_00014005 [Ensete ventricosum]|nr:hypothetical protein BHM03_00014005 [Ensete ventricosum]
MAVEGDKYRSYLVGEGEKDTQWRHGAPPTYDLVNKLFEEGRTRARESLASSALVFLTTSLTMLLSHKTRLGAFKSINPAKFKFFVNGRKGLTGEETLALGSYNALLQTSLPPEFQYYKADAETFESSHDVFRTAFPRGFAWEVLRVYSGPPAIAFKYRHWGYMEGPYKGHAPTGELVEFTGVAVLKVDEQLRAEEVEIYYEPGELFAGLLKGQVISAHLLLRRSCLAFSEVGERSAVNLSAFFHRRRRVASKSPAHVDLAVVGFTDGGGRPSNDVSNS